MAKMTIPVDLDIMRFYRTYVTVDENATEDEVRQAVIDMVCDEQDYALTDELYIEPHDIEVIDIDYDGAWEEYEDEETVCG